MRKLISVIIPALNEAGGIKNTLKTIPKGKLKESGYDTEVIVVDGGSEDGTAKIAEDAGAKVIAETRRGYGLALRTGFDAARGEIILCSDADHTYPLEDVCRMLRKMAEEKIGFLSTNRLQTLERGGMGPMNLFGNLVLSAAARILFAVPFKDSQSGMWVMKRTVWKGIRGKVRNKGMAFSQEVKIAAFTSGFKCGEAPVIYGIRHGRAKLNP